MLERVNSPYLDYHINIGCFVLIGVHSIVNAYQFPNLARCLLIQKLVYSASCVHDRPIAVTVWRIYLTRQYKRQWGGR